MTDGEMLKAIHEQLLELNRRVDEALDGRARPGPAAASDLVGVDYFKRVTGLARVTILQGKAGTDAVPRQSKRPSRWRKADVDAFQRARGARLRSPRQKAIKLLERKRA